MWNWRSEFDTCWISCLLGIFKELIMGRREEIYELLKVSMDNRNEYMRSLGFIGASIKWENVKKSSEKELEQILNRFVKKEKYYREMWRGR